MNDELLAQAAARAITYLRERDDRPVFPGREGVEKSGAHRTDAGAATPMSTSWPPRQVGSPGTVATTGGRHFGFVTGGTHPVGLAAAWLVSAWDQNAALGVMYDRGVLDRSPEPGWWNCSGYLRGPSARSSMRRWRTRRASPSAVTVSTTTSDTIRSRGLAGAPRSVSSWEARTRASRRRWVSWASVGNAVTQNRSMRRAACVLIGFRGRRPRLVVLQAGNVNGGPFDPFDAVAEHFSGTPHWIHVAGRSGSGRLRLRRSTTVSGLERAHSGGRPAQVAERQLRLAMRSFGNRPTSRTFRVGAAYIDDGGRLDPVHRGPDMSQRRCRRDLGGSQGARRRWKHSSTDAVDARRLADELAAADFTVHNDVVLNQVMVSIDDADATDALLQPFRPMGRLGRQIRWQGQR